MVTPMRPKGPQATGPTTDEQLQEALYQNQMLKEISDLSQDGYYRLQIISLLTRIAEGFENNNTKEL